MSQLKVMTQESFWMFNNIAVGQHLEKKMRNLRAHVCATAAATNIMWDKILKHIQNRVGQAHSLEQITEIPSS